VCSATDGTRGRAAQVGFGIGTPAPPALAPQVFDFGDGANASASAEGATVESSGSASKFKNYWKGIATKQGTGECGMKNVSGAGRINRVYAKGGAVMELGTVPGEDAVASERGGGDAAPVAPRNFRQRLEEIRNAEQSFREFARTDHEVDIFK